MQFVRFLALGRSSLTFHKSNSLPLFLRCDNIFPKRKFSIFITTTKVRYSRSFWDVLERKFSQEIGNKSVKTRRKFPLQEIKRLVILAKPERWKLAGAVCLLLVSSAVTMMVPYSLGLVIDIINKSKSDELVKNLINLSMVLLGIFAVGALCNFGRLYLISIAGHNMNKKLCATVFSSIVKQELAFFDRMTAGALVNRLSADTELVSKAVTSNLSDGLRSGMMAIFGVSYMFYISIDLGELFLCFLPVLFIVNAIHGRFVRKIIKERQDSLASASSVAAEKISNIRTVKAFGNENRAVELYDNKLKEVLRLRYKEALASGAFFGLAGLTGNVIILTVLCYGGVLVSMNSMTMGSLTSFLLYAGYIAISLQGLGSVFLELNKGLGASERLWQIVDRVPAIPITGGLYPENPPRGCILFEDVSFSYPERKTSVLQNLNLKIDESAITSIVGASGSGKSTIASLLLRLYDPHKGKILFDDVSLEKLSPEWIKKHVGFVPQEPVLFSGTIRENILYGAPNPSTVTEEELEQAARESNCYDFITKTFPDGFETIVGEKGILLSGGQKQRIALARALIKNPRILLLDEATSALDAESEHLVQEALEKIMKGRTVLVIAHRLSSIKNSDKIVVLGRGSVVEEGTYQELLEREEGVFKKLMKHQAFR